MTERLLARDMSSDHGDARNHPHVLPVTIILLPFNRLVGLSARQLDPEPDVEHGVLVLFVCRCGGVVTTSF